MTDIGPIPGLSRFDHIGITVPDLEQARRFFVDVIGCEYMYTLGPYRDSGTWMSEHLGVENTTVMRELHFFRLGGQAVFEVFEYEEPSQSTEVPKNSDIGGHHIAFYVDDMDQAITQLRAHGLETMGEPTVSKGPSEGQRWVYFRAPWGLQCELVSYPTGKAFDKHPEAFR